MSPCLAFFFSVTITVSRSKQGPVDGSFLCYEHHTELGKLCVCAWREREREGTLVRATVWVSPVLVLKGNRMEEEKERKAKYGVLFLCSVVHSRSNRALLPITSKL